ncbi:flagellar basal body P-ring protein FlgI, partial [Massilia sp.]|uniref:flagellar basal body P-ring protein FlgI n=1 Tax=Massilia sp. TaxID=1882437 RepID=UPI0028AA0CC8
MRFNFPLLALCAALTAAAPLAQAERLKDMTSIAGVRQNQLSGYGLVVGLDGTGDQTSQTPFTVQSIIAMLQQKGVNLPPTGQLQLKNVAAVMVTTSLPAFAQPGQNIDITVSSIGNAKSLRGGTLLMTPLHGADGQVYAMAQGNVLVGGVGASAGGGGAQTQINHLSVGKISAGATVERAVASNLGENNQ